MSASGHGLGVLMAIIFLAGEMAGVGVLALPKAMVGTGPAGFALIVYFTINAMFAGSRLGLCWVMITERFPEYRDGCRSPYMVIAEKATGTIGRRVTEVCVVMTLYGSCCVVMVLMGSFISNIAHYFDKTVSISTCEWMLIVAACLAPLCWFGSPADFWFVAVGALVSTVVGCVMVLIQEAGDVADKESCLFTSVGLNLTMEDVTQIRRPAPQDALDFGKAFSSIMFAFAGASTFPTIQADMKDKTKFPKAVVVAMVILASIYLTMSATSWGLLGDRVGDSVIDSLCDGPVKVAVEILFLIHLITAFPILLNPPSQFFEELFNIPPKFGPARILFRTGVVAVLLVLGISLPDFSSILDLIGASTITALNFIFPPIFYMFLADQAKKNTKWEPRPVPTWMRVYSWHMVAVGIGGGILSFVNAVMSVEEKLKEGDSCWTVWFE